MNDKPINTNSNINPLPIAAAKKKVKSQLKEKRNQQYVDITKECSKLNISELRIEDFAEARKKELSKFVKILNNKYSSKSGFQLLPKHMRRRSMSHNPFRIPIRARDYDLNVNTKSKCKKHKRRRQ